FGKPGGRDSTNMEKEDKDHKVTSRRIKLEDLDKNSGGRIAVDTLPLRVVEIVGAFPYKEQLEEFRKALRYKTAAELLNDSTKPDGTASNNFQFTGFDVERVEVKADGKPATKPDGSVAWANVSDKKAMEKYKTLFVLTGKQADPDDPQLDP